VSGIGCKDENPDLLLAGFFGESAVAVKVIRPQGGEMWQRGSRQMIQWQVQFQYSRFDLYLYKGSTNVRTIAVNVPDSTHLTWIVPLSVVDDSEYRIRIVARGTDAYLVTQSEPFRIYSP
jgi:hypothetical protein